MGFRFRKSVNLGPLRVNFSKSGIGYSVGGKGFRATKKAGGGFRTTTSIPGTGISYVRDYSASSKKKSSGTTASPSPSGAANQTPPTSSGKKRRKWPYVVAAVLVAGMIGSCVQNDDTDPVSSSGTSSSISSMSTSEPEAPALTSLSLDCDQAIELDVKDTQSIPVLVAEEGADAADVEFISSDPNVLTFTPQDDNGTLVGVATPKAEGTAEISVSAGDIKSQIITVTVIDSERIAAEEAAKKAAEEEAARKAAEEAAAKKAAEEAAAQQAAQQSAQQQQQSQQSSSNGRTVYITPTGKRYHYDNNCNGGTYIPSTLAEAQARGLTPCKKCAGG